MKRIGGKGKRQKRTETSQKNRNVGKTDKSKKTEVNTRKRKSEIIEESKDEQTKGKEYKEIRKENQLREQPRNKMTMMKHISHVTFVLCHLKTIRNIKCIKLNVPKYPKNMCAKNVQKGLIKRLYYANISTSDILRSLKSLFVNCAKRLLN